MFTYIYNLTGRLIVEEDGPTSVEYAVMLAMIVITMIGTLLTTGELQRLMFENTGTDMNAAMFPN